MTLLFVCLLWFEAWYVSEPRTSCRYHPSIGSIYSNRLCFWLSAPRTKQYLEGLLTVDQAFVYLSYEISLHVLLPMTIQLSMSGQPSHPMKSLASHKAPCLYELAHSRQFLVGEQLCKAQLTYVLHSSTYHRRNCTYCEVSNMHYRWRTCHFSNLCGIHLFHLQMQTSSAVWRNNSLLSFVFYCMAISVYDSTRTHERQIFCS